MQNKDKFATAKEAWEAFVNYCDDHNCKRCPQRKSKWSCGFAWLYAEEQTEKPTPQWQENVMDKFTNKE